MNHGRSNAGLRCCWPTCRSSRRTWSALRSKRPHVRDAAEYRRLCLFERNRAKLKYESEAAAFSLKARKTARDVGEKLTNDEINAKVTASLRLMPFAQARDRAEEGEEYSHLLVDAIRVRRDCLRMIATWCGRRSAFRAPWKPTVARWISYAPSCGHGIQGRNPVSNFTDADAEDLIFGWADFYGDDDRVEPVRVWLHRYEQLYPAPNITKTWDLCFGGTYRLRTSGSCPVRGRD